MSLDRGTSTCAFLEAIRKTTGRLYSFDIKDCSNLSSNRNWSFLQVNDLDIKRIFLFLQKFPDLKENGIDFYILTVIMSLIM